MSLHMPAALHALQPLLDAMEGVNYVVDADGRIVAIGAPNWNSFAATNGGERLLSAEVVGTSLFDAVSGAAVQGGCRKLHDAVIDRAWGSIVFELRCDAPEAERHMRLALSLINLGTRPHVLYQSQMLSVVPRIPMGLFRFGQIAPAVTRGDSGKFVVLCSYCQRVASQSAPSLVRIWITPAEYYRRGGGDDVDVSHGMCEDCQVRLFEPLGQVGTVERT